MLRPLACLTLLAAGCLSPGARRGDTVILASGADLQSPNPLLTVHPLARQVQRYALLVTLVRHDSTLAVEPYFAREWSWSPDSTTLTFRVFSGLRWHDGTPTTAADAAWTLDAARDLETGYPRHRDLAALDSVAAPDDTTLILWFNRPHQSIPDVLTDLALAPRHLLAHQPRGRLREAEWNRRPVGNGPFRFVSYRPNRRWVFDANPDFPSELGGPPRLTRLVIAVVDEPTTKLAALTSGELDIAGIHPSHAEFVRADPRLTVIDYPLLFTYALILNLRRPPLNDLMVRKALSLAIDGEAIVEGILFGFGTPAASPLPPELEPVAGEPVLYAPSRALPLLGSRTPRLEILTVGSGEAPLEQMIQAQLAVIGVRADIRQLELSTYLDRVQGPFRDFDTAVMGIPGDLELGHLARVLDLAGMPAPAGRERMLRVLTDSLPVVFLYHARGVQGMNRRVRGVRMDLRGELVTLPEWWVER